MTRNDLSEPSAIDPDETFVLSQKAKDLLTVKERPLTDSEIPGPVRRCLDTLRHLGFEPMVGRRRVIWTVLVTSQTSDGRYLVFGAHFVRRSKKQFDVREELLINFVEIKTTSLDDALVQLADYEPAPFTLGLTQVPQMRA